VHQKEIEKSEEKLKRYSEDALSLESQITIRLARNVPTTKRNMSARL
jgi:hypothetical protein